MNNYTVSSRIRFARNLKEYPFGERMTSAQKKELCGKVKEAFFGANSSMKKEYEYIDLEKADRIDLLSPQFVSMKDSALILSKYGAVSIMINEEDHLRIQVILPGLALKEAYEKAVLIEKLLSEKLQFAYSEKLGYLTACPTNLGTGMRASLMLHLPAISEAGAVNSLVNEADKAGILVRGANGEGSKAQGALFQLSNRATLGVTEKEITERLTEVASQIVKQEEKLFDKLKKAQGVVMEDKIMRAYGSLKYARLLSADEFISLYSLARMGVYLKLTDTKLDVLDKLYFSCRPATVASKFGKDMSAHQRDIKRAELCREALN